MKTSTRFVMGSTPPPMITKGKTLGDSIVAAYEGQNSIPSYLFTAADIVKGYSVIDQSVPANTIQQQMDIYEDDPNKLTYDWVIIQVGVNNLADANEIEDIIFAYQQLVDYIRATGKPSIKIIVSTMTPCKERLDSIGYSYTNWLLLNEAIRGEGGTPITGVNGVCDIHTDFLNDGLGNLLPEYEIAGVNDHIHINNVAKSRVALESWRIALIGLGLYTPDAIQELAVPTAKEIEYYNHLYYGAKSVKYNSSDFAVFGDPVGRVKDLTGVPAVRDLIYSGIPEPILTGVPPLLLGNGAFISFENRPDTYYLTSVYTGVAPPFEIHHVFVKFPGQDYEGRFPGGGNRDYEGNLVGGVVRIQNSSYGALDVSIEAYKLVHERIVVKEVAGVRQAKFYLNNVLSDTLTLEGADQLPNPYDKIVNGLGVNTNSDDFRFGMMGVVFGELSDSDATDLYDEVTAKWLAAGFPINDWAVNVALTNLDWTHVGNSIVPSFTVNNIGGKTLKPIDEWDYKWNYLDISVGLGTQPEFATTMIVSDESYPSGDTAIKFRVKPKFVDGTEFDCYISAQFKNIPPGTGY